MFDFSTFKNDIEKTIEWLRKEYAQVSVGRANPILLDSVMVDSYGAMQPVKNVASINIEDPRTLRISPWDQTMIQPIEKAIQTSGLPFAVAVDGEGLRASIPQLTEENKKSIVKIIKEKHEEARVTLRNERQKNIKAIDAGETSDDEKKNEKDQLQKMMDDANTQLDEIFKSKETDLMTI